MAGLILVLIAVVVFFWYKKKKQGNTSVQNQNFEENNTSVQNNNFVPLKNELEKQYYEMIYGLLASSSEGRSPDDMCRFIEFHTGKHPAGNFSKIILVSTYFKLVRSRLLDLPALFSLFDSDEELSKHLTNQNISAEGIETVIELNRNLNESLVYRYLPETADAICEGNATKDNVILLEELLQDDTLKQYYTIVSTLLEAIKPDNIDLDGAKKFIEFHTQQRCKSQKLKYALEFTKIKGAKEKLGITSDDINKYKYSKQEAYNIIYSEIIESIKTDCKEVFDVVASYGAKHFEEGLSKKIELYKKKIGTKLTQEFFRQAIQDMYFEGDKTTKDTLLNRMNQYSYDARMLTYYHTGDIINTLPNQVASIVLRALHFEKHGQNREKYKAITIDDCLEFVSNCKLFKDAVEEAVANDPFNVNKNELLHSKAKEIFNVFESIKTNNSWYLPCDSESYYADALCNGFLKWIATSYKKEVSTDLNKAFDILFEHFKPTDRDFKIINEWNQEAERQRQEEQAREAQYERERAAREQEQAAKKRCRACVNYYKCSYDVQKSSLSCSAFCPK